MTLHGKLPNDDDPQTVRVSNIEDDPPKITGDNIGFSREITEDNRVALTLEITASNSIEIELDDNYTFGRIGTISGYTVTRANEGNLAYGPAEPPTSNNIIQGYRVTRIADGKFLRLDRERSDNKETFNLFERLTHDRQLDCPLHGTSVQGPILKIRLRCPLKKIGGVTTPLFFSKHVEEVVSSIRDHQDNELQIVKILGAPNGGQSQFLTHLRHQLIENDNRFVIEVTHIAPGETLRFKWGTTQQEINNMTPVEFTYSAIKDYSSQSYKDLEKGFQAYKKDTKKMLLLLDTEFNYRFTDASSDSSDLTNQIKRHKEAILAVVKFVESISSFFVVPNTMVFTTPSRAVYEGEIQSNAKTCAASLRLKRDDIKTCLAELSAAGYLPPMDNDRTTFVANEVYRCTWGIYGLVTPLLYCLLHYYARKRKEDFSPFIDYAARNDPYSTYLRNALAALWGIQDLDDLPRVYKDFFNSTQPNQWKEWSDFGVVSIEQDMDSGHRWVDMAMRYLIIR